MRKSSIFLVLLIFYMATSLAQEAISPAGGDGSGSGGSVAYTVGQILYTSYSGGSNAVVLGVQQPYEISIIIGLDEFEEIGLSLSTIPNPVADILILKVESLIWRDLNYQMYDSEGRIIMSDKLLNSQTNIDMSFLAPGLFFLRVNMETEAVKTFKIIKK
jgi:hypothetical protein